MRTGKSRSSGLPYPNNFVAGDNLFRDFRVDLTEMAIQKLNPADRHVQENVRDVVLLGERKLPACRATKYISPRRKSTTRLPRATFARTATAQDRRKFGKNTKFTAQRANIDSNLYFSVEASYNGLRTPTR